MMHPVAYKVEYEASRRGGGKRGNIEWQHLDFHFGR